MKTVGILALQGDFDAHRRAVEKASADAQIPARVIDVRTAEVRSAADFEQCDALIIPGGESSTMWKLLEMERLIDPLRAFASQKPVYGSCAGAILLAREVTHPAQPSLGLMDIAVERNAYGRQIDSRVANVTMPDELQGEMEAVFIRAPIIRQTGPEVKVLASYQGDPVWAEQGRHMVTTFHPELTTNTLVHRRLLQKL